MANETESVFGMTEDYTNVSSEALWLARKFVRRQRGKRKLDKVEPENECNSIEKETRSDSDGD